MTPDSEETRDDRPDEYMHRLLGLPSRIVLDEPRSKTFDLHSGARLGLNVFHKHSLSDHVGRSLVSQEQRGLMDESGHDVLTPGPTTLALTLKFLILSSPIGNFSSGHFFLSPPCRPSSKYLSLFFANRLLSSTNGPRSASMSSLTRLMALSKTVWEGAAMCR
jgi:hypothetical protein